MTRVSRRAAWGLFLGALFLSFSFWAPAFEHPTASGWGDWQWFHHMWEAGRISIERWHELPLFDPHHCGGVPLWGNPQSQVFAPTYLMFVLPFGTTIGHKLYVVFHAAIGMMGTYLYARRELRVAEVAATFGALVFTTAGFFAWHGAGGHATFLAFYYGPFLMLCWRRSARDYRYAAAVALIMSLIVFEGGHYPFPYFLVWLGFDFGMRFVRGPRRGRMVTSALLAGALTGLVAAMRVVPILITILAHPHPVPDTDSMTLSEILRIFTQRDQAQMHFEGHQWVWPEYGAYVGYGALSLALGGLFVGILDATRLRPSRPRVELVTLILGAILFTMMTQGNAGAHYPWPMLQELPFYRSIHVPSRWRVMVTWHVAMFGALAIDALERSTRSLDMRRPMQRLAASLPVILLLMTTADIWSVTWTIVDRWDGPVIGAATPADHFTLVRYGNYFGDYANYPSSNVGTRECYDPIPWEVAPTLWLGEDEPFARLAEGTEGEVIDAGRTSNTLWADVNLTSAGRVIFDQNYFEEFRPNRGTLADDEERTAVDLPAGRQRVTLRYSPPDLPYVVTITLIGLVVCFFVARGGVLRRRRLA